MNECDTNLSCLFSKRVPCHKKTFSIFTTLDVADGQVDADVDVKMADGHAIFKKTCRNTMTHALLPFSVSLSLSLTHSLSLTLSASINVSF